MLCAGVGSQGAGSVENRLFCQMLLFFKRFGLVPNVLGPGINWDSKRARGLDSQIINSSNQPKVASFSPIAAPGVPNNPILGSIFLPPARNTDIMIQILPASLIHKDSTGVIDEFISDCDFAGDWASLVDLIHHVKFALEGAVLAH